MAQAQATPGRGQGLGQGMQDYDVIALQEPSYNPQTGGTHCSRGSGFWPVYEARGRLSRVALLFSKRLGSGEWKVEQVDDRIQVA